MGSTAYSTHRTASNRRKAAREGIVDQRGVIVAAKKTEAKDWLMVMLTWPWNPRDGRNRDKPARYKVVAEYKTEDILKQAYAKSLWTRAYGHHYQQEEWQAMFGGYVFMCEREVFNRCYRDLRL
jgi:hypothetical protein